MKLHRLRVENFGAIRDAEVAFGPGLNVLYGPNDLGKSTLADAIRLVLLLPYASTHCEPYIPWSGGQDPVVDLTFETEAHRFWRVLKEFGKGGSSLLQDSMNGQDFDDVERARKVDARLREILRWGIPEPGGAGAAKGLPMSFLATALLSTQADVTAVLRNSLQEDPTASGKEWIAAALQAVAQDPIFVALLRAAQARRDEAYTDKGAKKTAKGSVFKAAADRLKEARDEKERLQRIVDESESVERQLRELATKRLQLQDECTTAAEHLATIEQLAKQAEDRATAAECVRVARDGVLRIQKIDEDVASAGQKVAELAGRRDEAERALRDAKAAQTLAEDALKSAEEAARAAGSDPDMADTVARQALELRQAAAEQAAKEAQQGIKDTAAAQELVDAAVQAEDDHRKQQAKAIRAGEERSEAAERERVANDHLRRCDLLERAVDSRAVEKQVANARADVERETVLQAELSKVSGERATAAGRRAAIIVPLPGALVAMRKLATDLAGARGALDVGLVMTVTPTGPLDLQVRKDGVVSDQGVIAQPMEIEANTEVEVGIANLATVRVRGGRREAQEKARSLENRWDREILPHLTAAGVPDLDGLDAKVTEARELDTRIKTLDGDLQSLQDQIAALASAADALRDASARAADCRLALGDVALETLTADLDALGPNPNATLRAHRQQESKEAEKARTTANEAATAHALAEERARSLKATLEAAVNMRDAALAQFPSGVAAAAAAAQEALRASLLEQERITAELAALQSTVDARRRRLDEAIGGARTTAGNARAAVEAALETLTKANTDQSLELGRLSELRKLRDAQDLGAAATVLRDATERHAALPVPERSVTPDNIIAAQDVLARAQRDLDTVDREFQRAQGALEQVGGAVARERLRDAIEAFELAERQEREIEAEYEAWRLLLDQMKEADAAQASNLGQALAPAIADRFQALTQQRYQGVQLTGQLGTAGVVVTGALRPSERISVGTREQLSTLYRLALGEYLRTTIVLDDQLVQSDGHRMDWFRTLLVEKARSFQIVVFTCRPGDYLAAAAMVPEGGPVHVDTDEGFVRAVDLDRAVRRR